MPNYTLGVKVSHIKKVLEITVLFKFIYAMFVVLPKITYYLVGCRKASNLGGYKFEF